MKAGTIGTKGSPRAVSMLSGMCCKLICTHLPHKLIAARFILALPYLEASLMLTCCMLWFL